jgi:hypothetical protein
MDVKVKLEVDKTSLNNIQKAIVSGFKQGAKGGGISSGGGGSAGGGISGGGLAMAGGIAGAVAGAVLIIGKVITKVIGAVVSILKKIWETLKESSPMLQASLDIAEKAFTLFFKPFGDFLGIALKPMALIMIKMAKNFIDASKGTLEQLRGGEITNEEAMTKLLKFFDENITQPMASGEGKGLMDMLQGVMGFVGGLTKDIATFNLTGAVETMGTFAVKVANYVQGWVIDVQDGVETITDIFAKMKQDLIVLAEEREKTEADQAAGISHIPPGMMSPKEAKEWEERVGQPPLIRNPDLPWGPEEKAAWDVSQVEFPKGPGFWDEIVTAIVDSLKPSEGEYLLANKINDMLGIDETSIATARKNMEEGLSFSEAIAEGFKRAKDFLLGNSIDTDSQKIAKGFHDSAAVLVTSSTMIGKENEKLQVAFTTTLDVLGTSVHALKASSNDFKETFSEARTIARDIPQYLRDIVLEFKYALEQTRLLLEEP